MWVVYSWFNPPVDNGSVCVTERIKAAHQMNYLAQPAHMAVYGFQIGICGLNDKERIIVSLILSFQCAR